MLSTLLAAGAVLAILVVARALWRAVGRWEAAALAALAADDLSLETRLAVATRANGARPEPGTWSLGEEQALARSVTACFPGEVVEEITVEHPRGDAAVLHPSGAGGWH